VREEKTNLEEKSSKETEEREAETDDGEDTLSVTLSVSHSGADRRADGIGGEEAERSSVGLAGNGGVSTSCDDVLVHFARDEVRPDTSSDRTSATLGEVKDGEGGGGDGSEVCRRRSVSSIRKKGRKYEREGKRKGRKGWGKEE
jgi:hypothetical protein